MLIKGTIVDQDEENLTENDEDNDMTDDNQDEPSDNDENNQAGDQEFKPKNIACEEDDEFVKMFDTLMTTEQNVATSKTTTDLNIPMNLKAKPDEKHEGTVVFSLIMRKGNKANAKGFLIFLKIFKL